MRGFFGWIILLAAANILIIVGVTGRLGSAIGALLTPGEMEDA